jgi:hypothetical protein
MEWEREPLSPAALADEPEHRKFLQKCSDELRALEAPPRVPALTAADRALSKLCETIGKAVRTLVVAPLEARIRELEAQRGLKYVGPWKLGGDYNPGEFVSYGGGIWHCKQRTGTGPNQCHEAWTLAVKSGAK